MEEYSDDESDPQDIVNVQDKGKLHNYWKVLIWMLRWAIVKHPYKLILIVLIGGASLVLHGLALGGIFYLVDGIRNNTINILNIRINLHNEYNFIYLITILVFFFLFSGIGQRFYNKSVNNLSVVYEKHLKENIIEKLQNNYFHSYFGEDFTRSLFLGYLNTNTRLSGRTLAIFLTSSLDFVKMIIFSAICLFLELKITIIIFVSIFPIGVLIYKLNQQVHLNEINFVKYRKDASRENRELFQAYHKRKDTSEAFQMGRNTIKYLEAYLKRHNFVEQSEMIGHLGLTIGIVLGLSWVYYEYIYGKGVMAHLIVYLFSLRFLLISVKSMVHKLSIYTRHFRKVRELYEVLQ